MHNFITKPLFVIVSCFFYITVFSQSPGEKYLGTWRWVSGKKDTLEIVLKRKPEFDKSTDKNGLQFIGVHRYVENGKTVDSRFDALEEDSIITVQSISGVYSNEREIVNILLQPDYGLTHFNTRDYWQKGSLKIVSTTHTNKTFAILELTLLYDERLFKTEIITQIIPGSLVLEKVK